MNSFKSSANCERYYHYKAAGICVTCGSNWVVPGRVRCKACAARDDAMRRRRDPDGSAARERFRRLRDTRRAAGLCTDCGRPAKQGRVRCADCLRRRAESAKVYEIRKRLRQTTMQE